MKNSLIILTFFAIGVILGQLGDNTLLPAADRVSIWVLGLLMFLVGITLGGDSDTLRQLRSIHPRLLLVPAATIVGTLGGAALTTLLPGSPSLTECLAVGSGFGYYSLSSVLLNQSHGATLGTVALVSNILRELFTLLFAPLLVRLAGPLAPICCGGATTIDTTLPVIARFSGKDFIFVSIIHGIIIDFSVPVLVTLFSTL